jgi:hypothetical protein
MQIFGGVFSPANGFSPCTGGDCNDAQLEPKPRLHFDYFVPAMLTVFTLLTGEWAGAMRQGTAVVGMHESLYYVLVLLVGRFLIINLLIAVVLNAFSADHVEEPLETVAQEAIQHQRDECDQSDANNHERSQRLQQQRRRAAKSPVWPRDFSFGIFVEGSFLRTACRELAAHAAFELIVTLIVTASCIALALDTPRLQQTPDAPLAQLLRRLDILVWPWLFLAEMLVKAIDTGVCEYLRSPWHRFHLLVVLTSFAVLAARFVPDLAWLDNVALLRVLRPLELVRRNPGMNLVVVSLMEALPKVSQVLVVVVSLMAVFAIIGMQLFMGVLASCSEPTIASRDVCVASGHVWTNQMRAPPCSFDDFGHAMLTLYAMSYAFSASNRAACNRHPLPPLLWCPHHAMDPSLKESCVCAREGRATSGTLSCSKPWTRLGLGMVPCETTTHLRPSSRSHGCSLGPLWR